MLVSFGMIFMKSGYYYLIVAEEKNEREREIQVLHDALALTNKLLENWQRKKRRFTTWFYPQGTKYNERESRWWNMQTHALDVNLNQQISKHTRKYLSAFSFKNCGTLGGVWLKILVIKGLHFCQNCDIAKDYIAIFAWAWIIPSWEVFPA